MYKDLIVPLTGTPADADAIHAAVELGTHFGAHLTLLEIVAMPLPALDPWGFSPALALDGWYGRVRAQAELSAERRRRALAGSGVSHEVRIVEAAFSDPAHMASQCAQYGDLTVVAGAVDATADGVSVHDLVAALLAHSGRPLLVVPPRNRSPRPPRQVVLAWRPGSGTTRALHDALPLLGEAERVDVLIVDPPDARPREGPPPGSDVLAHLGRHGVRADVVVRESKGRSVGAVVLAHALAMPAHLIVAGGYGRSRLREWAVGGVTRELLFGNAVPLLLSH